MEPTLKAKDNPIEKQEIIFEKNKHTAFIIKAFLKDSAENIVNALDLVSSKPKSIILVFGGASGSLDTSDTSISILHQILDDVLQYASDNSAIIIDGGTKSGIMEIIGQKVSELDHSKKPNILGVAPAELISLPKSIGKEDNDDMDVENDKVSLDPNHSHFVLVEGDRWGDETIKLFEISSALAADDDDDVPVVSLLAGGGKISKKEILFCIDYNWPIIVIEKTGYLADEIATSYKKSQKQTPKNTFFDKIKKKFFGSRLLKKANTKTSQDVPSDTQLKKIISYHSLQLFPSDSNQRKSSFEQFLLYALNYDPLLESAWQDTALYDESAKRLQNNFNRFQKFILGIGVLATLLSIIQTQYKISATPFTNIINYVLAALPINISSDIFNDIPYYVLIVLPITISVLIAALNRFRYGAKWVLLRAAAEAIKGEIYHYRTKSFLYSQEKDKNQPKTTITTLTAKEELSTRISYIKSSLMKTDVSLHGLYEYNGPLPPKMYGAAEDDDGYSTLLAEQYIKIRIGDQISYYKKTAFKLEKQLKILQWLILLSGGAGTLLAAAQYQISIALTTTLVATFVSFLEYKQIENTLIKYNQTRIELENIKSWWDSLTNSERAKKEKKDELVQRTEDVLRTELSGWIRQMQVTIDKLYSKKEAATEEDKIVEKK
jgi:TRPM family ion channel/conflict system pore-forming effector with SLATT domain/uncharacterized protein DUF4231